MLVAAYWRTNLTLRQLAPLSGTAAVRVKAADDERGSVRVPRVAGRAPSCRTWRGGRVVWAGGQVAASCDLGARLPDGAPAG